MKYIIKRNPPRQLKEWFDTTPVKPSGEHYNCTYEYDLKTPLKEIIKEKLLLEQGFICCYTGVRIDKDTSHIEHLLPQSLCLKNEDVDYNNMLAAFPKTETANFPYGAKKRGNKHLPITPLQPACETRFKFLEDGTIEPVDSNDNDAKLTIKNLELNHGVLVGRRAKTIRDVLFPKNAPLTDNDLKLIIDRCMKRNKNQQYSVFCFVIYQVAKQLLEKRQKEREKKRKRNQAIRNQLKGSNNG